MVITDYMSLRDQPVRDHHYMDHHYMMNNIKKKPTNLRPPTMVTMIHIPIKDLLINHLLMTRFKKVNFSMFLTIIFGVHRDSEKTLPRDTIILHDYRSKTYFLYPLFQVSHSNP